MFSHEECFLFSGHIQILCYKGQYYSRELLEIVSWRENSLFCEEHDKKNLQEENSMLE